MLADMIVEEEFEIKDEEPWYDQQDLEHDLHLAAELGKTLLDRNRELEQGLKQMYSTNQEQLQEIEYLTKQVDLLRQMNEQHAKVYEQLDVTTHDLEQGNRRLVLDNRTAQHKIQGLTETIDSLQTHVEELQQQVEEMKTAQAERSSRDHEHRRLSGAQSVSCIKELYSRHKYLSYDRGSFDDDVSAREKRAEEESLSLRRSVQVLQTQLEAEHARRREAEQEAELMTRENGELERRLGQLEGCQARLHELEEEVEELRRLWRSDAAGGRREDRLLPDAVFFPLEERANPEPAERDPEDPPGWGGRPLKRCSSETLLRSPNAEEIRRGHELTCVRRAQAVKQRGVSLLNEVDAQYSALQVKYDELLRRCQQDADRHSHKAVQTPAAQRAGSTPASSPRAPGPEDEVQPPEYKALFQEIFSCIQKTKLDLSQNRAKLSQAH